MNKETFIYSKDIIFHFAHTYYIQYKNILIFFYYCNKQFTIIIVFLFEFKMIYIFLFDTKYTLSRHAVKIFFFDWSRVRCTPSSNQSHNYF